MANMVPVTKQQVTAKDAFAPLVEGLTKRIGAPPKKTLAGLLLCQIWMETARGKLTCWSVGNLAAAGFSNGKEVFFWSGDSWRPPWFTNKNDPTYALMMAGQEPSAFRAYRSLGDSIDGYLSLLFEPKFQGLLTAAASGDAGKFAQAIRDTKYTPRLDVPATTKTFAGLYQGFVSSGILDALPDGDAPAPALVLTVADVPKVANGKAATLFQLQKGSQGALVAVWQTILNAELGVTVEVSGMFDDAEEAATKTFQTKMGFAGKDVDGVVGPMTWSKFLE